MKKFILGIIGLFALGFIGRAVLTYAQNTDDVFAYLPIITNGDEETVTPAATMEPGGLNSNYFGSSIGNFVPIIAYIQTETDRLI